MKIIMIFLGLGVLSACGQDKKNAPTTAPDAPDMGMTTGMEEPGPVNGDMEAAPRPGPPGGNPPGACRNVAVPNNSSCRLSSLRLQNCPDCAPNQRRYRSGHLVKIDGTDHGFESGAFLIPADREEEFKKFMQKNSPVPCSGLIVHPPCNPAATHVELELVWPGWVHGERL